MWGSLSSLMVWKGTILDGKCWYFRISLLRKSQWEEEKSHLSQIRPQLLRSAVWIQCLLSLLCSSPAPEPTGRSRMHS